MELGRLPALRVVWGEPVLCAEDGRCRPWVPSLLPTAQARPSAPHRQPPPQHTHVTSEGMANKVFLGPLCQAHHRLHAGGSGKQGHFAVLGLCHRHRV